MPCTTMCAQCAAAVLPCSRASRATTGGADREVAERAVARPLVRGTPGTTARWWARPCRGSCGSDAGSPPRQPRVYRSAPRRRAAASPPRPRRTAPRAQRRSAAAPGTQRPAGRELRLDTQRWRLRGSQLRHAAPARRRCRARRRARSAAPADGARRRARVKKVNATPSTPRSTSITCFRPERCCRGRSICVMSPVTTVRRTEADARQEHLHLLDGGVLRLVEDDERVVERAAAHEGERRDLDDLPLDRARDAVEAEHLVQRVVHRAQIRIDLLRHDRPAGSRAARPPRPPGAPARCVARCSVCSASTALATAR